MNPAGFARWEPPGGHVAGRERTPLYGLLQHPPGVVNLCFPDSMRPLSPCEGRTCHRPPAYSKVAASTIGPCSGYRPDRRREHRVLRPSERDGGTRSGAEEAVGWGWDPPEATRSAIFAFSTLRRPGRRCGPSVEGSVGESRNGESRSQDTREQELDRAMTSGPHRRRPTGPGIAEHPNMDPG